MEKSSKHIYRTNRTKKNVQTKQAKQNLNKQKEIKLNKKKIFKISDKQNKRNET